MMPFRAYRPDRGGDAQTPNWALPGALSSPAIPHSELQEREGDNTGAGEKFGAHSGSSDLSWGILGSRPACVQCMPLHRWHWLCVRGFGLLLLVFFFFCNKYSRAFKASGSPEAAEAPHSSTRGEKLGSRQGQGGKAKGGCSAGLVPAQTSTRPLLPQSLPRWAVWN